MSPAINLMSPAINLMSPAIKPMSPAINPTSPAINLMRPAINLTSPAINPMSPSYHGMVLMLRDFNKHDHDEQTMQDIDDEMTVAQQTSLEHNGHIFLDHDLLQLQDDIDWHANNATETIIESFEKLDHSDSEDD